MDNEKKFTEMELIHGELVGWIMGLAMGVALGFIAATLLSGCAVTVSTPEQMLERDREHCLDTCLTAQNECGWALSASPCETFCQEDLHLSTVDPNVVCVGSHDFDRWQDCQLCIIGRANCTFGQQGGQVCLAECSVDRGADANCR